MPNPVPGKNLLKVFVAGLLLLGTLALVLLFFYESGDQLALKPHDLTTVNLGKRLYAANCASCHGKNLEGQPNWQNRNQDGRMPAPPHDSTGHTWHHADALLIELTRFGLTKIAGPDYKSDMPAFDGVLSDREIVAVLSYIKSTWPKKILENNRKINDAYIPRELK
jgi:mono/diheme cytochrome c family protein